MIKILFQGDSITDGNRYKDEETRWDLNHQIGHSYAYIVAATLGRKFPGKYHFVNRAIASDCVDRLSLRWDKDTLDEHPDVLSILIGINGNGERDGVYPEGVEAHLSHFDKKYRELLDRARAENPNLKIVIIEPFTLPVGEMKEKYDGFIESFSREQRLIEEIAHDYGAVYIPVQKRLEKLVAEYENTLSECGFCADAREYWLWDGIHPTEAMHGVLAELWLDATKNIL